MEAFYGGKKCIITNLSRNVHWSHMLDAASVVSNTRVCLNPYRILHKMLTMNQLAFSMLSRNLRADRHPRHAAEVRENLVPSTSFCFCQLISDY